MICLVDAICIEDLPLYFMLPWEYIAMLRMLCKALSKMVRSPMENEVWREPSHLFGPVRSPLPKWFVSTVLREGVRKRLVNVYSHKVYNLSEQTFSYDITYTRPMWDNLLSLTETARLKFDVFINRHGFNTWEQTTPVYITSAGITMHRRQVAFQCPILRTSDFEPFFLDDSVPMPLWNNYDYTPYWINSFVPGSMVMIVQDMWFASTGSLVVSLHNSVMTMEGRVHSPGHLMVDPGGSFGVAIRINGQLITMRFRLKLKVSLRVL
jgi:hypothetical protein